MGTSFRRSSTQVLSPKSGASARMPRTQNRKRTTEQIQSAGPHEPDLLTLCPPETTTMLWELSLLDLLPFRLRLVKLRCYLLGGLLPQRLLDEPAGVLTGCAGESFGLDGRFALRADDDLDGLHAPPPATDTVSLIE